MAGVQTCALQIYDPTILAVASDTALELDRPVFDLDDTAAVADFILAHLEMAR